MSLADYLIGVAYFAGAVGGVAFAAAVIVRRRLPRAIGAPRALATAIVFTALLIAAHLIPLAVGALSRPAVVISSLLIGVAATRISPSGGGPVAAPPPALVASGPVSWSLAAIAAGILTAYVIGILVRYATVSPTGSDFTVFHLPGVARWLQIGSAWRNNALIPDYPVGAYPNNGDVVFLAAVLPWRNDAFVRLTNFPFLALAGISVYAIAQELRAPRAAAVLFGAVVVATESVLVTALDRVKPETLMLAMLGAGVLFLLRHRRTGRTAELVLAGTGLGLAFGARWEGVMAVAVILIVFTAGAALAGQRPRLVVRSLAILASMILATGGFWLVRNVVVTGDPVFPVKVAAFGVTLFDAPFDPVRAHYDHTIAEYLTNGRVLSRSILPDWRIAFGVAGVLLAAGLALALTLAIRCEDARVRPLGGEPACAQRTHAPVRALAIAAVGIFALYTVTPAGAQGFLDAPFAGIVQENARWAAPALLLAATVTAWCAGRLGRWGLLLEAAGVVAVVDGIAHGLRLTPGYWGIGALAAAGAGGAVAIARRRRRPRAAPLIRATVLPAVAACAAACVIVGGELDQRRFNAKRYGRIDPTIDWVHAHAPSHRRVGIAGEFGGALGPQLLSMFGPRFGNSVAYVGPWDGGFLREYRAGGALTAALRRGRYDLVLVGRGLSPRPGTLAERATRAAGLVAVAQGEQSILFARPSAGARP
jgi:hypothetical protein